MVLTNGNGRAEILAKIIEHIHKKIPGKQAELISDFARQFYGTASYEDLQQRNVLDLYGAILSHWDLIKQRLPGETKLHIFNPHFEQHGWQSTHTIVEFIYDDMPFLVDSLRMEINRQGYTMHFIVHFGGLKVRRDEKGNAIEILPFNTPVGDGVVAEAPIYIEIDRQTQPEILEKLKTSLENVLKDVYAAVTDWRKMRDKVNEILAYIEKAKLSLDAEDVTETKDFLQWTMNDHYTYLGYRYYEIVGAKEKLALKLIPDSGLGVLRNTASSKAYRMVSDLTSEARKLLLSKNVLLILAKTNTRATVHRPVHSDLMIVKVFNDQGEIIGEHHFIGLYTSSAYNSNPKYIPLIRRKVGLILRHSNLSPIGHAGKVLLNILETLPRDDLFQASAEELTELAMGILHLQERKNIRLFARKDIYGRFMSCLVYVPRERFTTELADAFQEVLLKDFNGLEISYTTRFSDSVLARLHFLVRLDPKKNVHYDLTEIEKKLVEVGRAWIDELRENLLEYFGEEKGNLLFQKYQNAFPASYRESFNARTAIYDIEHIEALNSDSGLAMGFYRPLEEEVGSLRFKLFRPDASIPLSDAIPIFENMGLRVMGERPYEISLATAKKVWINDFSMLISHEVAFEVEAIKRIFQDCFFHVWTGQAEDDSFNRLVLSARLSWREIMIIRAYCKYLKQTGFTYSQSYIEEIFAKYPVLAHMLAHLFLMRFDPQKTATEDDLMQLELKIKKELDNITLLDEDRILRRFSEVINATIRTNYFQLAPKNSGNNQFKSYFSLKLDPSKVPELPLPLPMFEIFVYSPRFEGVHLRSSKVARGGLRWSDRREDFRTEILGLMKAQVVKNAVIVPSGAKGGFVPKALPVDGSREEIMTEVIYCYKNFVRGLLDLTDNLVGGVVVPPNLCVRYDDDDTYLVVAADKGTATFSDIANSIAQEYKFWLDDAFASGGSTGYDHKKIGITARGAWESVKRHFRELGHDIQNVPFTVVGIGDMAGDVFGNGMLLSRKIQLVATFNHEHIFLDPNPDLEISYQERQRLFNLPRSTWEDYDRNLISKGGGVYRRTAKAIKLTTEVKELFNIKKDFVVPNELIRSLLTAQVDLLWNGGIGTFVKSSKEDHLAAGDRTNDAIRVNGAQLQCKVVGEGGNLGFTQLGRIEYALLGGHNFTDFIDNSAGVDCSDHEVNIKILLNSIINEGDMTGKQRNTLLAKMTDDVAELVLHDNYEQTEAISTTARTAFENIDIHSRVIQNLAEKELINLELEYLPTAAQLLERKTERKGLTRPELSILFSYCKSILKQNILSSDVPEDPYLSSALLLAFPQQLREKYKKQMKSHPLSREIIATLLSNAIVNEMGFTIAEQLSDETGAPISAIVRAYTITRNVFQFTKIHHEIHSLDYSVDAAIQYRMLYNFARLLRRATRWLLRNRCGNLDITSACEHFGPAVAMLYQHIDEVLVHTEKEQYLETKQDYLDSGVHELVAKVVAGVKVMGSALDIIEAANMYNFDLLEVAKTYFILGEHLHLGWLRAAINILPIDNEWDGLAREACRDDLDWQQRGLTIAVLQTGGEYKNLDDKIEAWLTHQKHLIKRWHAMLANLRSSTAPNFVMFTVAVRELMDLTQTSFHGNNPEQKLEIKNQPTEELSNQDGKDIDVSNGSDKVNQELGVSKQKLKKIKSKNT